MANTILHKRSSTQGAVPATGNVSLGELVLNTYDGRLFTKKNDGVNAIVDLTQNDKITLDGDATGTSTNPAAGTGYSNLTVTLSTVNSNTGTWGGTGQIPAITLDAKGRATAASNIALNTQAVTYAADSSNITANTTVGIVAFDLTSTGVSAGTYGSGTSVPTIVVDAKGRITSVTTNSISTSFTLAGTSGSATVAGGSTLSLAGTYGVTVTVGSTYANISTPQDLQSTASPSFTGVTAGEITISGNSISSTNAVISIDPSTAGVGGTVIIAGNLQVTGTTTTVNSTTVDVADLNLTLAKGAVNAAAADGAGLTIDGASATWNYTYTTDSWNSNKHVVATSGYFSNATTSTDTTTGALQVVGGIGVGGNVNIGGNLYIPVNGSATNVGETLLDLSLYSVSDSTGAGNLTITGNAISLALTGPGAGTHGSATHVPVITTDAYGRIAAVANTAISLPFSSITSTPTTLSGYGITDALSTTSTIDGGTY